MQVNQKGKAIFINSYLLTMYKTHVITKKTSVVHEVDVRLMAHKAVAYVTGALRLLPVSYMEIIK